MFILNLKEKTFKSLSTYYMQLLLPRTVSICMCCLEALLMKILYGTVLQPW